MKVKTLLEDDFDKECRRLTSLIEGSYKPDLIVGVLTGGGCVGQRVYKEISKRISVHYCEVRVARGSTEIKRKINIKSILRKLPNPVLNFLRVLEVHVLELMSKIRIPKRQGEILMGHEIRELLESGPKNILIVDDCVDTGATLKYIIDYFIGEYGSEHNLRCAVITKAHKKPLVNVDYLLYNRVLIRFPWSFDTKKKSPEV
ncbi:phosphoribosyltransferase [Alkalitalea saponilacus]|uniref:Hypoxanthine phosphoribosyltransferase n=1 Tax=Alkalitalea saponilacus TaxID=889453 RepID=A0A1T5FK31_9BACT|nr:phosphoribosyltransferase family protein [Alkalitalea saponilacus]ASB49426.1 hypothetical protein CDL62_09895 [Alkalitalea saponilacus]SKB96564.1 Hypoxanthine phosphoribosyltransferase [Alkalitalea saponilacus]